MTSDRVNELDWAAEVFYRRLMSKVDDHGCYDARTSVLRATLYPLKVDRVREADISRWMTACQKAGLIVLYEAEGKPYLQVLDTKWKTRSDPKFPLPTDNGCKQLETTENSYTVVGDVVEDVNNSMSGKPDPMNGERNYKQEAVGILDFLNEKTGRNYQPVDSNLRLIIARLKEGREPKALRQVIANRCRAWYGDDKMDDYLRPKTLFNATNFANYEGLLT